MKIQTILPKTLWPRSARSPSPLNHTTSKPSCMPSKIPISLRPSQSSVPSYNTVLQTAPCHPLLLPAPRPRRIQRPRHRCLRPRPCKHRMLLLLLAPVLRLPPHPQLHHPLSDQLHNHQLRRQCPNHLHSRYQQHPRTLLGWGCHLQYHRNQSHHLEEWRLCSLPVHHLRPHNRDTRMSHHLWRPKVLDHHHHPQLQPQGLCSRRRLRDHPLAHPPQ